MPFFHFSTLSNNAGDLKKKKVEKDSSIISNFIFM